MNLNRFSFALPIIALMMAVLSMTALAAIDKCTIGVCQYVSREMFDRILPPATRAAVYDYDGWLAAADRDKMFTRGTPDEIKREIAAFFAQMCQETGCGKYDRELACQPGGETYNSAVCNYCIGTTECGPSKCSKTVARKGLQFWGRGANQFSGDRNYCRKSKEKFGDTRLYDNPDLILTNPELMWSLVNDYWMKEAGPTFEDCGGDVRAVACKNLKGWPAVSAHVAMHVPDPSGKFGFAASTKAYNGALECTSDNPEQKNRILFYKRMLDILNVAMSARDFGRNTCY